MTDLRVRGRILIVDDEPPIRILLARHLEQQGFETATAASGQQALLELRRQAFDLVLSDIRMPEMDGVTLLAEIGRLYPQAGVVMLTACEDVSMAVTAMKAGASDYVLKPFRLEDVDEAIRLALEKRREKQDRADYVRTLEDAVTRQTGELRRVLSDLHDASETTLDALVSALDAREHETKAHSRRVGECAVYLAKRMDVEAGELEIIRRGAMLHDIGKIGIPDRILLKPDRLTEGEWREMRRHPEIGHWILSGVDALRPAAELVLSHHERFDGRGYPRGLIGRNVVLGARIFSVVDCLDAITSDRPYHRGEPYGEARRRIAENSGSQFDPDVVDQFLAIPGSVWAEIRARTFDHTACEIPEITQVVMS